MGIYRVPLVWQMYGHMDVEAKSLHEAIEYALGPECPLPEGSYVDENTLAVAIRRLRVKIEEDPGEPRRIRTVHGQGYLWQA